jgi:hypothetical protein
MVTRQFVKNNYLLELSDSAKLVPVIENATGSFAIPVTTVFKLVTRIPNLWYIKTGPW